MARPRQPKRAETYTHDEEALLRPEVGTQAQFRKRKPPKTHRYDSSLSPALDWDGQNGAREFGEWLIAQIEEASALEPPFAFAEPRRFGDVEVAGLHDAVARLKALSRPFLDWAGKAERLSFDVPTLPLFVHERLSTKAILQTLSGHKRDRQMEMQLFADPQLSLAQQLEAYEHKGGWVNRMILGDSLVVMNSLVEYEGLGGQVQMIYIDPPYGVKFGSNFQPFVRKRDVKDGDDGSLTREPEMVKAYRDTWELGLHSYLSYLRDRLLVARELLTQSGSVFVQIGEENVHAVRSLLDEVFGEENKVALITFVKSAGSTGDYLPGANDYLIWHARDIERVKFRRIYGDKAVGLDGATKYDQVELSDGSRRPLSVDEKRTPALIPAGARVYRLDNMLSQSIGRDKGEGAASWFPVTIDAKVFLPNDRSRWKTNEEGMQRLLEARRVQITGNTISYVRYLDDFPAIALGAVWEDIGGIQSRSDPKIYAVQTATVAVQRCVLMTTDPGDLVLDPTCGSGTTAFVSEQWGRRWITVDTSRVPVALARQRLLTATFPYYDLQDTARGPAGGFTYRKRQNARGDEVGGIIPHVTLRSVATGGLPLEDVVVDRPEVDTKITRVTGPFVVEATIPTPRDVDEAAADEAQAAPEGSYVDRMLEALRRSPVIQAQGNRTITLKNVRPPSRSLSFSAEAALDPDGQPVAIVFGPENGAVGERLINEAVREAYAKSYEQLLVIGFAIEPNAREFVEKAEQLVGIPVTYVQATPDLVMGDLLKTMRSSQIFSVSGLPDVAVRKVAPAAHGEPERFEVELRGLDVFDPSDMSVDHRSGDDVPAWLLDTDYNSMVFHVSQAFFPRTGAWDSLKRALKGELEDSVWDHLAGTTSAPFEAGGNDEIAVKVIDDRGNELLVVKKLSEAQ
ncbi:MAG: site-specific DNA-methyltransferase [Gaiella sp.]